MTTLPQTLTRPRYSFHATTAASDLARLHFDTGTQLNVLKTDPALAMLSRGDSLVLGNGHTRDVRPGLAITIHEILRVDRHTPVYLVN